MMHWLITYSQTENGKELSATTVTYLSPGVWFSNIVKDYPNVTNKLLFAIKISEKNYNYLCDKL